MWNVASYGHYEGTRKTTGNVCDVDMEKNGACKMDRQNKNALVLERVREGRILELIKKRKRNWLGH